jgi:hypothetical protein
MPSAQHVTRLAEVPLDLTTMAIASPQRMANLATGLLSITRLEKFSARSRTRGARGETDRELSQALMPLHLLWPLLCQHR